MSDKRELSSNLDSNPDSDPDSDPDSVLDSDLDLGVRHEQQNQILIRVVDECVQFVNPR